MCLRIIFLLTAMSIVLYLPIACSSAERYRVYKVIDGDTIVISGGDHIRYIGIDAPEKGELYYQEAAELNKKMVAGKKISLVTDISDEDHYGRKLRYVYVDEIFVNAEIVRQGLAFAYPYPPDIKYHIYLEEMETEARINRRGLWHNIN